MLRITGGEYRSRLIRVPRGIATRPSHNKLRQGLFNSPWARPLNARILDLFAGSGSLGFEALSRGARQVVFVEQDAQACEIIRTNAASLRCTERLSILQLEVGRALASVLDQSPYDLVFCDPPYAHRWESQLLRQWPWNDLLAPGGVLWFEKSARFPADSPIETPAELRCVRQKIYGESALFAYQRQ